MMRLTTIKLSGFKSFVDPTSVQLPSNRVAIVGPNGSGKSNIIDAVRWVMGESSAKTLRGDSMTDVIFNGSSARKPVGQASVELIFDNSGGRLGGEYANYATISVKRLVTRDGQSNYFLNNNRCRRRDITDIFLGTGLGPRSYAIIMQDTISRLIEAKPEQLRIYLEEAAGISKYKERRHETELRMQHTRENLERLNDLREELGKQLSNLQRQANAAERYKVLREQQREMKGQLISMRCRDFESQFLAQNQLIREHEVTHEAAIAKIRSIDADFEKQQVTQAEVSEIYNQIQEKYYALAAEIARLEQTKKNYIDRQSQLKDDLENTQLTYQQALNELTQDKTQISEIIVKINDIEPQFKQAQSASDDAVQSLQNVEETLKQYQNDWESFQETSAKNLQEAEMRQLRIQHIEEKYHENKMRLQNLLKEKETLDASVVDADLQNRIDAAEQVKISMDEKQKRCDELHIHIKEKQEEEKSLHQSLHQEQSQLQQMQGKFASLEALQQVALGQKDQSVMQWLEREQLNHLPRLAQNIRVENNWEIAVETVIGSYLDAICIDNLENVIDKLIEINEGNLTFISPSRSASVSSNLTSLATKVSGDDRVKSLLQHIYIADDSSQAFHLSRSLANHESIITKDGIWLGNHWAKIHKAKDEKVGVIHRQQDLDQLKEQIQIAQKSIRDLEEKINHIHQEILENEDHRQQIQINIRQLSIEYSQAQGSVHVKKAEKEQLESRFAKALEQISETEELLQQLQDDLHSNKSQWQRALQTVEQQATEREMLLSKRDEYRDILDEKRQYVNELKNKSHELAIEYQALKSSHQALEQAIVRADAQVQNIKNREAQLLQQLEALIEPLDDVSEQLYEVLSKQNAMEQEVATARQAYEQVETRIRELNKERHQCESEVENARQTLEHARSKAQAFEIRRGTFEEQLAEMGLILSDVLATLPQEANEQIWESELEEFERKIARLGPINLAAIEEFATVSERKTYLDSQNNDLVEALTTLEEAIRKIDRETKQKFKETYDLVNGHFQNLFPKIFGGGSAYLELTGEDLLETGVSVIARPPGKRNSTIHLLSGGEKALTAISLVFSLFQLNPAPFCILDEVDAPLDDANVGRFCSLVKEMSNTVQFIFISHNKLAIEMAQHLTGVAMREPGVSRLVAVDIEEAVAMASA